MKFESNESFKLNNNMNYHWLIDRSIWSSIIWHHEFFPYYHFSSLAICPPVAWFIMPPIHTFIHSINQSIQSLFTNSAIQMLFCLSQFILSLFLFDFFTPPPLSLPNAIAPKMPPLQDELLSSLQYDCLFQWIKFQWYGVGLFFFFFFWIL